MEGGIRLFRTVPGPTGLAPLVAKFCREGEGFLTAFDDAALASLATLRPDEDCEVIAFPGLVSRALAGTGESHGRLAGAGHQTAAVAHALREISPEGVLGAGAPHVGLHRAILRTLHELHAFGIDAEELESLAGRASGALALKLRELSSVDADVQATMGQLGRETHGAQICACLDALPDGDGAPCRAFVLVGGARAPQRLEWLRWAASAGWELTVVVERHATDGTLFRGAREAEAILGVRAVEVGSGHRLLNNLFARGTHEGPALELEIRSAPDPLAECEWALRGCLEAGPENCGLYVRDLPSYAPLLRAASRRLGVPVCAPQRVPLLTNAFARLTLAVLEFAAGGDVRTLRPVLSSSYLRLTARERRTVETALRDCHVEGGACWERLESWCAGGAFPWLERIVAWRREAKGSAKDLGGWLERVRALVHEMPWQGAFGGEAYDAGRDVRAFSAMQNTLADAASVERTREPSPLELGAFAARCRTVWEAADVSLPTPEIGVPVASHASGLTGVGNLFVLGMLEGAFPRRAAQDPVLGDDERRAISRLRGDLPPLPLSADRAAEERDEFYRVCAAATRRLVLSYPQADDTRDNVPAFYIEAAAVAAGRAERQDLERGTLAPASEYCLAPADVAMRGALDAPRERPTPVLVEAAAARAHLSGEAESRTAAELRDALRCPFLYAARHRLKLHPNRREARWHRLRALPQAAGLAACADEASATRALTEALEASLALLAADAPEWEMPLLRAGGQRLVVEWVRREFAARRLWGTDPSALRTDVAFGEEGVRSDLPFGVVLKGVAAAVSSLGATKTMHLFTGSIPLVREMTDADRLFFGLHLLAIYEPNAVVQLEVDATSGRRTRLLIERTGGVARRPAEGLDMEWLVDADDPYAARQTFFGAVRASLKAALKVVGDGEMRPNPGDDCESCEFGELCRRARGYGEEDSPFGGDARAHGVAVA